jgi:hypothetical protein
MQFFCITSLAEGSNASGLLVMLYSVRQQIEKLKGLALECPG